MLDRILWCALAAASFAGGLVFGRAGFKAEPGPVAAVLEPWLW